MSSYYDAFGGSSGPPDPFEDEESRRPVPANRLVSTFIRPGLAEFDRRSDQAREEDSRIWTCNECGAEGTESEMEHHHCEEPPQEGDGQDEPDYSDYPPEYEEWPELNDHADSINIVTGEVEE